MLWSCVVGIWRRSWNLNCARAGKRYNSKDSTLILSLSSSLGESLTVIAFCCVQPTSSIVSMVTKLILLFLIGSPSVLVAGQECSCPSGSLSTTFHLDPILAKETTGNNDNSATAAAASLSLLRAIHYRYCELPRTETKACGTRLHFSPAAVCSEWKTKYLPPIGVYTPIFWGPSVPTMASPQANCPCSQPAPAGPSIVFATTEEADADTAATTVCFSYRQQILNEAYGCDNTPPSNSTTQAAECVATRDDQPTLHRLVLEQTSDSNSPTLYVDYTFYDPVGPSALQTIFPSAPTCNSLHVLQACVGTARNDLAGMYQQRLATDLCRPHPDALGSRVYIHHGIQENTILYYNGQLDGWVFVPEQHYCTETADTPPFISAIFQPSSSNEILCFVPPADGATTGSLTEVSTIEVQCVADDDVQQPLDPICRGMDADGGTVFSQECVSPTVFRQQYSLCRNGVVVGTDHRVQSCFGLAGIPRETYCHDTCGSGFVVCSTTTDSTAACQLTQSQDCHGGVWGWVTAVGCTDDRSSVSFTKLCEDGVVVGGLQTSEPVPCATNDARFTTCHDTCPQFSVCSSAAFTCPQPTVPPTWVPTTSPTLFPTAAPTVFTPPTYRPTKFPTTMLPTPLIPPPTAVPDVPSVPASSGAQTPMSFMLIVGAVLLVV